MPDGLCGVPHHAYVISGTLKVIYKDGSVDVCKAGDVCYWPAPHNFISDEGAEIIQFSGSGALAAQAAVVEDLMAKQATGVAVGASCGVRPVRDGRPPPPLEPGESTSTKRKRRKVKQMLEWIEKFFDKHFLGSGTKSISPESEVAEAIRNDAYIVDVRLAMEAKKAMVPGATNIDMLVLKRHLDELPRDRTIVTYCKTGGRAGKARDILDRNGFKVLNGGGYETVLKIVKNNQSAAA